MTNDLTTDISPELLNQLKDIIKKEDKKDKRKKNLEEMTLYVMKNVKSVITKDLELYIFDKKINKWISEPKAVNNIISRTIHKYEPRATTNDVIQLRSKLEILSPTKDININAISFNNCVFDFNKMMVYKNIDVIAKYQIDLNYYQDTKNIPKKNIDVVNSFFNDVSCNDNIIKELLWQLVADALEPKRTNQLLIFFTDFKGGNGKSTFASFVSNAFGSSNCSSRSIKSYSDENQKFSRYQMWEKLLNVDDDVTKGFINPAIPKVISGGGRITIEEKNIVSKDVQIDATLWHNANQIPNMGIGGAIERRILIVPMEASYTEDQIIKFEEETKEILFSQKSYEYLIHKAIKMLEFNGHKIKIPDKCKELYKDQEEMNCMEINYINELKTAILEDLPMEELALTFNFTTFYWSEDLQIISSKKETYDSYRYWCNSNGIKHVSNQQFKKILFEQDIIEEIQFTQNTHITFKKGHRYYRFKTPVIKEQDEK